MIVFTIISLILLGFGLDFLITLHYRYIAESKPVGSATTSFLYLVASFLVYKHILTQNAQDTLTGILAYSFGAAFGCYLAVTCKKKNKL